MIGAWFGCDGPPFDSGGPQAMEESLRKSIQSTKMQLSISPVRAYQQLLQLPHVTSIDGNGGDVPRLVLGSNLVLQDFRSTIVHGSRPQDSHLPQCNVSYGTWQRTDMCLPNLHFPLHTQRTARGQPAIELVCGERRFQMPVVNLVQHIGVRK